MIFIRSQILKQYLQPYIHNNNNCFSLIKKSSKQPNLTNPFQNRTYTQINRIMSMNISQKNESIFCNFVLKTINERITKQQYTQLEQKQKQSRQQLINRVFDKLMNNHIQNITPQDLYTILHTYYKIQQIRTCKITQNTRIKIKDILFPQIAVLLEKDNKGQYKQIFKNIFQLMIYFKKKTTILRHIIDYMSVHALKTNQELIDFFQRFSYMNRSGFYDTPMELLIGRLMNNKKNNFDNLDQWVKPIVLQTVVLYSKHLRIEGNFYLSKILAGIQRKLDNNSITLKDKILYLGQLFEWCRYSNPYFINLKDSTSGITLIYNIIQSIQAQLDTNTKIQLQHFINLASCSYRFQQFIQISARILQKTQKELSNQLSYILYKSFQLSFGDGQNLELQDLLQIINAHAGLPHESQQKLNKTILSTINKNKNSNYIINWLRLLQSLAISIKQQKTSQITRNQIIPILKYLQKKCKSLRIYQNIRLYNIARILDIKSQILQQQISYILSKNQTSIIQNMSRTVLKKYSYNKIQQILQSLKQKYNKSGQIQVNNTIIQSLWFSFKNIGYQKLQQNQNCDPIFIYWFNRNYQFFQKIVKNRKNNLIIISHVIAELNTRKIKQGFPSINYQLIFQLLRTWYQLNPAINYQQQCTFYLENLKNFIQSQQFRFVLIKKYRHSFFIKSMWAFYKLNTHRQMIKNYSAKTRSFKQLLILAKQQKLSLYRQKQNLRTSILYRNLQFVDQYQALKLQQIDIVNMAWFWSNYHGYKIKISNQIQGSSNFEQQFKKYLIKNYQYTYYLEYILSKGKISLDVIQKNIHGYFKQSIIPEIIYTGQFNKQSIISQQLVLQLLVYQKCMNFLIRKYPHISDTIVQKIIEIKNPIMNHKIIQAANFVYKIRQLLKLSTRIKFVQWLRDILTTTCNPIENPTNLYLCLQFNINTAQLTPSIHAYICQQLTRGNFNIAPLLYINGYRNIPEIVQQFLQLVHANRVLVFMQQIFPKQYILLTNSLLGLTLHQNNQAALQKYITLFLNPKILQKIIKLAVEQNKQIVYQFYILLSIALTRIRQNSKSYKILTQISTTLANKYKITYQTILQNIINKNNSILQLYKIKLSQDVNTGLHIFNDRKIVIHNEQPGYVQLVIQYLEGCGKMEGVIGKTVDQLLGEMEGAQGNVNIK